MAPPLPQFGRSSLIIDIKPYGEETNLDEVLKLVKEIEMEGLTWGKAHKKTPFAFGLFKLQVMCAQKCTRLALPRLGTPPMDSICSVPHLCA